MNASNAIAASLVEKEKELDILQQKIKDQNLHISELESNLETLNQ